MPVAEELVPFDRVAGGGTAHEMEDADCAARVDEMHRAHRLHPRFTRGGEARSAHGRHGVDRPAQFVHQREWVAAIAEPVRGLAPFQHPAPSTGIVIG